MTDKSKLDQEIRKVFATFGKEGGERRAKNLTPEQRKRIAKKAAKARWSKGGSHGRKS